MIIAQDILTFWFERSSPKDWFAKSDAFDASIRQNFENCVMELASDMIEHTPHDWEQTPSSALALIIALDQFPRNMYRDNKAMFAHNGLALGAAKRAVDAGFDYKLEQAQRSFIYMPYMHSENLDDQTRCVKLVDARLSSESTLHHAKQHRRTIERFGRFPYRNSVLERASTSDEIAYLNSGGYTP